MSSRSQETLRAVHHSLVVTVSDSRRHHWYEPVSRWLSSRPATGLSMKVNLRIKNVIFIVIALAQVRALIVPSLNMGMESIRR